jgi:hypothetical protein
MHKAVMVLAVIGVGGALVAAGCGGDDDDDTTTAALSKQDFISHADAICAKGDKQLDQAGAQAFGKDRPSKQEIEQFASGTVVPNIQGQVDEVRALPPPQGDEEQVSAFLDSAQQALDKVEQDPSLISQRGQGPFAETTKLGKEYGFKKFAS